MAYKYGPLGQSTSSLALKRFIEKRKYLRTALLLVVLLGAGMVIGDGVVTPAMSGMVEIRSSERYFDIISISNDYAKLW